MTDILIPKKNIVFDSQILSTLMSCARLTDFRFNMHLQPIEGKSKSLEMGSIVHKVLEYNFKAIIAGKSKSEAQAIGLDAGLLYIKSCEYCTEKNPPVGARAPCGHPWNDFPGISSTSSEEAQWCIKTAEEYFDFYRNDFWVPLEVETVKAKILYEDDDIRVMWKAKLDLLTDTSQEILPVDHKTMKQRRDSISLNNQFIGQCIVCNTRKMIVNKIGFQTSLKPAEKFTRAVVSYSADRLIEWQSEILPYYAKLYLMYAESEYFPPNFTHCENKYGFCQFKSVCESNPNMREEELRAHFYVGEVWDPTND